MIFAHDTEDGLDCLVALVNSHDGDEHLPDVATLSTFLKKRGWTGRHDGTDAELRAVRALRPKLRQFWELDEDGVVELVNTLLRDARALPQLVKHDGWDYHLHATPSDAPLADRIAVEAAMAFADLIRTGQLDRLRGCAADGCDHVHVDLSKNRSRRFCSTSCANRTNVAAYRARRDRQQTGS
jgi:predicted RNA-binding Zn ribbon-like protein